MQTLTRCITIIDITHSILDGSSKIHVMRSEGYYFEHLVPLSAVRKATSLVAAIDWCYPHMHLTASLSNFPTSFLGVNVDTGW